MKRWLNRDYTDLYLYRMGFSVTTDKTWHETLETCATEIGKVIHASILMLQTCRNNICDTNCELCTQTRLLPKREISTGRPLKIAHAWWRPKWKHFPSYWPFVRGIHRWPVNSPLKGQWRGALMFSLVCAWINGWVNNREAGDLIRHRAHYDVIVMWSHWSACHMYISWDALFKWAPNNSW